MREITKKLNQYDRDPNDRMALEESKTWLNETLAQQVEAMNPFERTILGRIYRHWLSIIEDALKLFREVQNPYQAAKPLRPDSPLFVGREETFRWFEEELCTKNRPTDSLFLHGGYHTGKTSILLQLEDGPRGERLRTGRAYPVYPVFIDVQNIGDPGTGNFLLAMADCVAAGLRKRNLELPSPKPEEFRERPTRTFELFLQCVTEAIGDGLLVLMLDEFELLFKRVEQGKVGEELFEYLRHLMQHQTHVAFVLAAPYSLDVLNTQYKTKLYNVAQHREIGFLSTEEADELVRRPVETQGVHYDDEVVARIRRLTGGHPYFIQQLCQFCIDLLNKQKQGYQVRAEHLSGALERALRPGNVAIIADVWNDVGGNAQRILHWLAELSDEKKPWVAGRVLCDEAKQSGLTDADVSAAISKLSAYHLVETDRPEASPETRYRHNLDLMRLWVLRQQEITHTESLQ